MSRRSTLLGLLGAGLLGAGVLSACTSAPGTAPDAPVPDASSSTPPADVSAAWLDGGRAVAVVTRGSSSCVPVVDGQPTLSGGTLSVALANRETETCTRDFVPRATFVGLPPGVDPTAALTIVVTGSGVGAGTATLAGLDADAPDSSEQFTPSAGWAADDLVAIVTWGSSSCRPQVESVVGAESGSITVTFTDPPADQVCTMDLAPRVSVADLSGVGGNDDTTLVLTGGGITATGEIAVLGRR